MERRNYTRLAFEAQMTLSAAGNNDYLCEAQTRDISYTGIGLKAPQSIEPGTLLAFSLKSTHLTEPLTGTAAVRFSAPEQPDNQSAFFLGLEFTDTKKDTVLYILNRLQKLVAQQLREKSKIPPLNFIPY